MTKTLPTALACAASLCAGIAFAALLPRATPPRTEGAAVASAPSPSLGGSRSGKEAGRQARELLRQLASDPFMTLSDGEIASLAAELDLTHSDAVHLLNGVLNPTLHDRLWDACLRASANKLTLDQLRQLAESAIPLSSPSAGIIGGIFDRIRAEGKQAEFFADAPYGPLYGRYLAYYAHSSDSLAGAIGAMSPSERIGRESLVTEWARTHADVAHFRQYLDLAAGEGSSRTGRQTLVSNVWKNTAPEERQAFFDELGKVDAGVRNDLLSSLPWKVPKDDPALLLRIMDQMTSFDKQEMAVSIYTGDNDWQAAQRLRDYIDSLPDSSRYARIRADADQRLQSSRPKQ